MSRYTDEYLREAISNAQAHLEAIKDVKLNDFKVVCDESNNTPESIEANELRISIEIPGLQHSIIHRNIGWPANECPVCGLGGIDET